MPKAQNIQATRKRHQRTLTATRGYFGNRSRLYKYAKQAVTRGLDMSLARGLELENRLGRLFIR